MKQSRLWLLALLTVLTLVAATTAMAEEGAGHLTGSWELGMSGINTDDNAARVNEYGSVRQEDGVSLAPQLDIEFEKGGFILELESETMGPRDQKHGLGLDFGRVFKLESELTVLEHNKDHETLAQMGATARDDIGGGQPSVTTDNIYANLIEATGNVGVQVGGGGLASAPGPDGKLGTADDVAAYDPAVAWDQEVNNNYVVTRREWKNEAELVIPQLANVTFKAGVRIETREGMEQSISLAKCASCHVSAVGKEIDERTEEYTLGATGKFGLLTVDYEYLTRDFDEQAGGATRWYQNAAGAALYSEDFGSKEDTLKLAKPSQLIYDMEELEINRTPDSEKDSHMLKARLDLPNNTILSASYVKADIESQKSDQPEEYTFEGSDTLKSEYEGFNGKLATKFGPVRLSLRGGMYEIDGPKYSLRFPDRQEAINLETTEAAAGNISTSHYDNFNYSDPNSATPYMPVVQEYESAESREVTEFGFDAVYRLARATTLRLGYEYEDVERDEEELGETETHSFTGAISTRINKSLSGRISYKYQDIDEPFAGVHVGIAQEIGTVDPLNSDLWVLNTKDFVNSGANDKFAYYWNSVYSSRTLESSNQPEEVHEAKLSTTWSPSANMAATFYMRFRYEENDTVEYEQTTFVPGMSFWYAPSDKLNLTMSYTFNNQDTENRICVGWYHG